MVDFLKIRNEVT